MNTSIEIKENNPKYIQTIMSTEENIEVNQDLKFENPFQIKHQQHKWEDFQNGLLKKYFLENSTIKK